MNKLKLVPREIICTVSEIENGKISIYLVTINYKRISNYLALDEEFQLRVGSPGVSGVMLDHLYDL